MAALVPPGPEAAFTLCKDGDTLLEAGELSGAVVRYTLAFKTHAASTMAHMRGLERSALAAVISTLEGWLDGPGPRSSEGLNRGLVAVFLSTLSPNNVSATVFKMESLLESGGRGCEEIAARCTVLLEGRRSPRPGGRARAALELTRALACLLAEPSGVAGLRLYLAAYRTHASDAVAVARSRQERHVVKMADALSELLLRRLATPGGGEAELAANADAANDELDAEASAGLVEFLAAVAPLGDTRMLELRGMHLLWTGAFAESAEAFTTALLPGSAEGTPGTRARLLTGRAAARFSAGRVAEACGDLVEAFETHPGAARQHFGRLCGGGVAIRQQLRQQAERGLSAFRERVLAHTDLRSAAGLELLVPVVARLRTLCHLEPHGGGRELRVRLAEALLLRGEHREALSICSQLVAATTDAGSAAPGPQSYQSTVRALRGYARLLSDDHRGATEDFQAVIEHSAPHPASCVRALCGRGLLRALLGRHYLAALDYATAGGLRPVDTALCVRCLVPWNHRGLLVTVLLEQGRAMLEQGKDQSEEGKGLSEEGKGLMENGRGLTENGKGLMEQGPGEHQACPALGQLSQSALRRDKPIRDEHRTGTPGGVHSLAVLLTELQPGAEEPQVLASDALYRLGRVEEAYRLLLAIGPAGPTGTSGPAGAPVLARLALLQLHRGFLYDANQLLKKLIQCGDTSCLRPLLAVAHRKDRLLLRQHCHAAATRILGGASDESAIREAVAYLSIAIMASGGEATDSLLERARCYAMLGQSKTAIFDFSAILKEQPNHTQALCGRGFTYLMLNRQKECTQDLLAALQISTNVVTNDILSLKEKARNLVCDWLHQYCRDTLSEMLAAQTVPCQDEQLREAFLIGGALMRADCRDPRWHLLHVDTLLAKGEVQAAAAHLSQVFGQEPREAVAQARMGVVEAWRRDYRGAARRLGGLAEKDASALDFLLCLVPLGHRKRTAQAAAQEARAVSSSGHRGHQALQLLMVAVHGTPDDRRVPYLRQRAACLARLGLHERAVRDLDQVILSHGGGGGGGGGASNGAPDVPLVWAEDLCERGLSLLLSSREGPALEDWARALELHRERALSWSEGGGGGGPGRPQLAQCFLRGALQLYGEQRLDAAWRLVECGLLLDGEHAALRRLRSKVKRETGGPCNVN